MASNLATPVVFVTAHADFESRARSTLSGGNDFIAKPFLLLELAVKALNWLFKAGLNSPPPAGPGAAALESHEAPPPPPPVTPNVITAQTVSDSSTDCSEGRKRSEVH